MHLWGEGGCHSLLKLVRFQPYIKYGWDQCLVDPDHICIIANVLSSMKKNQMYRVVIVICETLIKVSSAYCLCPAVAVTIYQLL